MIADDYKIVPRLIDPTLLAQAASACEMADRDGQREYYDHHAPIVVQCCNHLVRHVAALEARIALLEAVEKAARAVADPQSHVTILRTLSNGTSTPIRVLRTSVLKSCREALAVLAGEGANDGG